VSKSKPRRGHGPLRAFFDRFGLKYTWVANQLGVNYVTLQRWMDLEQKPGPERLRDLQAFCRLYDPKARLEELL
jgi:hypothetical protein